MGGRTAQVIQLDAVNVIAELDRIGWAWTASSEDEVKVLCPFHDDKNPSVSISTKKKLFRCYACPAKGDFVTFLAKALKTNRNTVLADLDSRYGLVSEKPISSDAVERQHAALWKVPPMLRELYDRGISDDTIRERRLGFSTSRITIPVKNERGIVVNVRRYLPGASGPQKMRNTRAHGKIRLYPIDQLKYDKVVVCGGEIKSLAVGERMNEHGFGALCATAGEGNWLPEFSMKLEGKEVWVCMDVDAAGAKAANRVCAMIKQYASDVHAVVLPLDVDAYPHGDVNDYFGAEEATADDFLQLLLDAPVWEPESKSVFDDGGEIKDVHLSEAMHADNTGRKVSVKAVVRAIDVTPYLVPKTVKCECDKKQSNCHDCPVYPEKVDDAGLVALTVHPESPGVLEMVASPKSAQREAMREALRIPQCKAVTFHVRSYYSVEDARVSPQLDIMNRAVEREMMPAMIIGHGIETNSSYALDGRVYPHPRNQQATLLVSDFSATGDALSSYEPTTDELLELTLFQPEEWTVEAVAAKLKELYLDLETNVTRIYRRRDLHLMMDLAWHSPLLIPFDRQTVKGWVEVLIAGDSSQGKSETALSLMRHYGLGERVDCKNASVAGLLGGLQQVGSRWFVTWGVIPMHDKRLVVLEELKGTSADVIAKLTDMRSSGIAEIPKIEKRRTHARTRLVALSNPRSGMPMSSYNYGVEVVKELIGSAEDVRRFDAALLLSMDDVDVKEINELQRHRPEIDHKYTTDLCRRCVLWAWSRKVEEVEFTSEATELVLDEASTFCGRYSEMIPLVDKGSFRLKLARLAASLAARTFSCTRKNPERLVIRPCHVQYVRDFLRRVYDAPTSGYADYSQATMESEKIVDERVVKKALFATPFPKDITERLLNTTEIELRDICDWCGWDRGEASNLLSLLVRKRALRRVQRSYRKTSNFIAMLRDLRESPEMEIMNRPDFVKDEEF